MKISFYAKALATLMVISITTIATVCQAQDQPMPPTTDDSALPANIAPGTPLAQVVKLIHAGMDTNTILSYIVNSSGAFDLDTDKIIFLKDEGASSALINAMIERDKVLYANGAAPAPTVAPVSATDNSSDTTPPTTEVNINYFDDALTPYGSWIDIEGYGRCWRPTTVIYDSAWRPYCDRGHWVNTDYGWYWDSDYSWGVTFHYGRWFRDARYGWCWYPDTVWAPSWVTWRSDNDYCGWAPLPPLAVYRPGIGFFYHGSIVGADFDFGLNADCYIFVPPGHFYDRHPRYYSAPRQRVPDIFHQTRVINNFNVSDRRIVNRGIPVERIASATHRALTPVRVGALPDARRQGWRGENFAPQLQDRTPNNGRNFPNNNGQLRHGPAMPGNPSATPHSQTFQQPGNHNFQDDRGAVIHNPNQPTAPSQNNLRTENNNHPPLQNQQPNTFHQPEPQQRFVAPNTRTYQQNNQWESRNAGAPALSAPPIRSAPPARPPEVEHAPPPPPHVEQHQNVPPPHNNPPPPPRAPAPPPSHSGDKQHN